LFVALLLFLFLLLHVVLLHVLLSARRPQPPFAFKGNEGGERKKPLEGVRRVEKRAKKEKCFSGVFFCESPVRFEREKV